MATPLGHGLAGYLVYRSVARSHKGDSTLLLSVCVCLAISPDLDFLPGIFFGQPALYHQGVTHSLIFAGAVGLIATLLYKIYVKDAGSLFGKWSLFSMAYVSHLFLDLFGPDNRPPYGIPLFWPFSEATYLSPVQIFWGVHHAKSTSTSTTEWVTGMVDLYNVGAIGIEVAVVLPWILLLIYLQRTSYEGKSLSGKKENNF